MRGGLTLYSGPASSQGSLWLPATSWHSPVLPATGPGEPALQSQVQDQQCNSRVWAAARRRQAEGKAREDLKRGQAIHRSRQPEAAADPALNEVLGAESTPSAAAKE